MKYRGVGKITFICMFLLAVLGVRLPVGWEVIAKSIPYEANIAKILSSTTTESAILTASDGEDFDQFGIAVAVSGDTAVIGSDNDGEGIQYGAAYIYERNSGGIDHWGEVRKLTAPLGADYNYFGSSVAISGDVIVVGAYGEESFFYRPGAAYVFQRNQGGENQWGLVKKLSASDSEYFDQFGYSVAVSGDIIAVGAYSEDGLGSVRGAVYIFERNQGGSDNWGEVTKLTASDAEDEDYFGYSVAINGDTVVVGAFMEDGAGTSRGAAYIYDRNQGGTDNWGEVSKLTSSDSEDYDYFGISVGIYLDTVVVGAYTKAGEGTYRGAAYVFGRDYIDPDNWGEVVKLTASDAGDYDYFGQSVSISGDIISIAVPGGTATYIYKRAIDDPDSWEEIEKLVPSGLPENISFGYAISSDETSVLVGAPGYAADGEERGAAYVFNLQSEEKLFLPIILRSQ